MPFIARISAPDWKIPVRAYLHSSGIEAFDLTRERGVSKERHRPLAAAEYLGLNVLGDHAIPSNYLHNSELFKQAKYLLVALYGSNNHIMAEVFGYGDFEDWPGNPTKYRWTFEDISQITTAEDGCGDTDIVLGEEEKLRRRPEISDLRTFMLNPPDVGNVLTGRDYIAEFHNSGHMRSFRKISR